MAGVRTRFAPSPTGYMHIGNLRTALYEYLLAKVNGGTFILRIEDTDQERFVEGSMDVIYNTLRLARLTHEEGPDIGGEFGPYIQSARKALYFDYAKQLIDRGGAYYCFCTKERLATLRTTNESGISIAKYDRHCASLSKEVISGKLAKGEPFVIRQKMPESGSTSFLDAVFGTISVENSELDDQVLLKSDGMPTYNFANVVDDHLMEITHVVRGSEYLSSTPKYNLLYESFGWQIPIYVHLPLIMNEKHEKLSKRKGDASFEDLLAMGYLPEAIINYIALLGWSPGTTQEIFSLQELEKEFSIKGINKAPAVFDINKLSWLNSEYIRRLTPEEFYDKAKTYLEKAIENPLIDLKKVSKILQQRTEVLSHIPDSIGFFNGVSDYDTSLYVHKKMKTDCDNSLANLKIALDLLQKIEDWNETVLHESLIDLAGKLGIKNGQILWPIRTAISGMPVTPGGAIEVLDILGKEESIKRIKLGIEKLSSVRVINET